MRLNMTIWRSLYLIFSVVCWSAQGHAEDRDPLLDAVNVDCGLRGSTEKLNSCYFLDTKQPPKWGIIQDRDRQKQREVLIIPTQPVTGIESWDDLAPLGSFWQAGLRDYRLGTNHLNAPIAGLTLALNSAFDRSRQQLHIHVGCSIPTVRTELSKLPAKQDGDWLPVTVYLKPLDPTHPSPDNPPLSFSAIRISGDDISTADIFNLFKKKIAKERGDNVTADIKLSQSLAIVAIDNGDFAILNGEHDGSAELNPGFAEELIDPACGHASRTGKHDKGLPKAPLSH